MVSRNSLHAIQQLLIVPGFYVWAIGGDYNKPANPVVLGPALRCDKASVCHARLSVVFEIYMSLVPRKRDTHLFKSHTTYSK